MRTTREDTAKTRQQLLRAAIEIFATKGYRDATIAEICARAGANIAAINYHFRSKEALYREAWRQSLAESVQAHPGDGGVSPDAPAVERLRGQVKALLERVSDANNREFMIVQREMVNPTGLLAEVMREDIEPLTARIRAIIREILGPSASETQVQFCEISIMSQCINPAVVKTPHSHPGPQIKAIAAYAEHVVTFSLGGLDALTAKSPARASTLINQQDQA